MKKSNVMFVCVFLLMIIICSLESCNNNSDSTTQTEPSSQTPDLEQMLPGKYRVKELQFQVKELLNKEQQELLDRMNERMKGSGLYEIMSKAVLDLSGDHRFKIKNEDMGEVGQGTWALVDGQFLKTVDDETGKIDKDTIQVYNETVQLSNALNMNELDPDSANIIIENLGVSAIYIGITMKKD